MEHMTAKKILLVLGLLGFSGLYLYHWAGCHLSNLFFFSPLDMKLRIIFDVGRDQHVPAFLARTLHNKLTQGSVDVFNAYVAFWDIRFLLLLLSPFTVWGFGTRLYYLARERRNRRNVDLFVVFLSLLVPLPVLFHVVKNDFLALLLFALPIVYLSARGWVLFVKKNTHALSYAFGLLLLSLWFLLSFGSVLSVFCHI